MRIVVCVKHVPDIQSDRAFSAEGRVVRGSENGTLNELDEHPIEEALSILESLPEAERETSRVIALTVGPATASDAIRRAFQLGVHAGVHVHDAALAGSDYFGTARALAAAVRRLHAEEPVDLVLAGMAALDGLGSVVPALLSAELDLPQLTLAAAVRVEGGEVVVQRDADGVTEELAATLPAVVSVTDQINKPRYPSFAFIMAARSKEVVTWSLDDLGLAAEEVGELGARTEVVSSRPRPPRPPVRVVTDDGRGGGGDALADFIVDRQLV